MPELAIRREDSSFVSPDFIKPLAPNGILNLQTATRQRAARASWDAVFDLVYETTAYLPAASRSTMEKFISRAGCRKSP